MSKFKVLSKFNVYTKTVNQAVRESAEEHAEGWELIAVDQYNSNIRLNESELQEFQEKWIRDNFKEYDCFIRKNIKNVSGTDFSALFEVVMAYRRAEGDPSWSGIKAWGNHQSFIFYSTSLADDAVDRTHEFEIADLITRYKTKI